MSVEPLQDVVRLMLESAGYFVRSNVRYAFKPTSSSGGAGSYGDLDILALQLDNERGGVRDRLWAEMKAHLTSPFTEGYVRGFAKDYVTMLGPAGWSDPGVVKKLSKNKFGVDGAHQRQETAERRAREVLGPKFRRRLYFAGLTPADGGEGAKKLLHPDLEVVFVRDVLGEWIRKLSHLEGNEGAVRIINVLAAYGFLKVPEAVVPSDHEDDTYEAVIVPPPTE